MQISCNTVKGYVNNQMDRKSQDAYSVESTEGLTSICVCDGAGFSDYSAIASKEVSRLIAKFMIEHYDQWNPEVIHGSVISNIGNELNRIAFQYGIDYKDLATTIMGVCLSEQGKINMLHLGDGNIMVKKKGDEALYYLSSAQTGMLKNQTFLTGNDNSMNHLRVYCSFKNPEYEEIFLITDGGDECIGHDDNGACSRSANNLLFIDRISLRDDCTCIKIIL